MRCLISCVAVLWLAAHSSVALPDSIGPDPLARLHWLQGQWRGSGEGEHGAATLQRQIICALGCRYLNVEGEYRQIQNNPAGEFSTALGMWSVDPASQRLLLHTFDEKASVTTYIEDPTASSGHTLVLLSEDRRTGTRARFTYTFMPPDEYRERFELARRGEKFQIYIDNRFERVEAEARELRLGG